MVPKRTRSKKQFAASSTAAERLKQTVFYLDESIYSRALFEALTAAGVNVRVPTDACGPGATDEDWLRFVGAQNWIVLMRDQRIRYRVLEISALTQASVGAFVFVVGQATAADTAAAVLRSILKFANIARSEPKPFLYSFRLSGKCNPIHIRR